MSQRIKTATVFISGNFNVLHAGHIRLFAFAKQLGNKLVVGVNSNEIGGDSVYIDQQHRLEAIRSNSYVDEATLVEEPIESLIKKIKPDIVVKGKEFEHLDNPEQTIISELGGRIVYGTSEVSLSSLARLKNNLTSDDQSSPVFPKKFLSQYGICLKEAEEVIEAFKGIRVCVVGDFILDEYITCEALGMSQEDPSLVVTPLDRRRFIGGAGIVSAHAANLGASSTLITVMGRDSAADFATATLEEYGVDIRVVYDESRPTTLKQRFRADGRTLLRVSHLMQTSISLALQEEFISKLERSIASSDLLVFSDFNYGCLPQPLADVCSELAHKHDLIQIADSQCSSQVGDISRFKNMSLIAATEREARISLRDNDIGLSVIAEKLCQRSNADNVIIKLGADGSLLHMETQPNKRQTDQLPALNRNPVDVAGAGDSMLITAGLALTAGATPWMAAAIGSLSAALQIGRLGNIPLTREELVAAVRRAIN